MAHRLTAEQVADRALPEARLSARVSYRARKYGWRVLRFQRAQVAGTAAGGSWRTPTTPGFPDLMLVRERLLFVELKKELGVLRPEQEEWKQRLEAAGQTYEVWRPSDLRSGHIEEVLSADYNGDSDG